MHVFVINCGSSSLKYQLFRMPLEKPLCVGLVDRIGLDGGKWVHRVSPGAEEKSIEINQSMADHGTALLEVVRLLTDPNAGLIKSTAEIDAVGHRVVHGGETFASTTRITDEVKSKIRDLFSLAPLHNPANLSGIEVAEKLFPGAIQVAVFDTAFHQSMPEVAFRYAIPRTFYTREKIRAYGFHGTSHKYVTEQAGRLLNKTDAKLISMHLGNGCSMTAVRGGRSLDTSMGFGPVGGLIMGTRSGDMDTAVIFHLIDQLKFSPSEVNELLNKKSGMLGLTGYSDMRDIRQAMEKGDREAQLAFHMYAYRIKKYIGAYTAVLNGLDALIFTGGVGEHDELMRQSICSELEYLGVCLDKGKNQSGPAGQRDISREDAPVRIFVIAANEELEIARQCYALIKPGEK